MDLDPLRAQFLSFSRLDNHGITPLYSLFCRRIAADRDLLQLAQRTNPGQPPPNMFLAAVHYLLLSGTDHPLARYYRSCTPDPEQANEAAWAAFRSFCLDHFEDIAGLISTRRTQTNEVGRCAMLVPAFAHAAARLPGRRWHLIEIGSSAGLNLNWDAYRYRYGDAQEISPGVETGIDLTLSPRLVGPAPPPEIDLQQLSDIMAMRSGTDTHPVDLHSPDDRLWLQALIFSDRIDRMERLRTAIRIAEVRTPPVRQGNGVALLPELLQSTPAGHIPLVFHSFVRYQLSAEDRNRFDQTIQDTGSLRDLVFLSIEWIGQNDPTIEITIFADGVRTNSILGTCHPHGEWIQLAEMGTRMT